MHARCAVPLLFLCVVSSEASVEQAVVDAALTQDDQCAADGDDRAGHCALQALQLKALAGSREDKCTSGIVGRIRKVGPECFDACPEMCGPLDLAVKAFFRRGGIPAVKRVICRHQENFHCALLDVNREKCKPIVVQARSMRVPLPESIAAFSERCERRR